MNSFTSPRDITFVLEPRPQLDSLERVWRELDRTGSHSFFLTWTWVGTWLKTLPPSVRPMLLKAVQGPKIVGLALLTMKHGTQWGISPRDQAWLNSTGDPALDCITIEHNGFATQGAWDDQWWPALVDWFAASPRLADELVLSGIASESLAETRRNLIRVEHRDPAYRTPLRGITDEEGIESLLSRNARHQLRRSMRDYEREAPLRLDVAQDLETGLEFFTRLKALHMRSWDRRGRHHAFYHTFFETFHRALIAAGFADGNVDLLRVSAGQSTLGYLYNFRRNGTVFSYQSGFDDAAPGLRPGYVCHALAMAHYAAAGMSTYDFLAGSNQLKQSFGTELYELRWIQFQKPSIAFRAEQFARTTLELLKRRHARA